MKQPNVEGAVDDLIGEGKPAAKPAAPKKSAPAKAAAAAPSENKKAPAAGGKKPVTAPAKKAPAAPAKSGAKSPAKPAAAKSGGTKGARGSGKFYFAQEDKEALAKELKSKVRKPTTTAEYAAAHELPTWKVRLAAVHAGLKLQKAGAVLTMHPAK